MQEILKDPFEEYIRQSDPDKRALGYAWYTAIGLQDVDGLKTSDYLRKTAEDNINGHITLADAGRLIESYYEETSDDGSGDNKEADIVSARIARMLAEDAFTFSVPQYTSIHKRLFEGIYSHAGKIRDYNISKKEWVLDGDTVRYGNYTELEQLLEYDIRTEKEYVYRYDNISNLIRHLAKFISRLWQIHAFGEGNTRTTAVFFIKYLRSMGFDVTNDIFARHSWYFRNALVRANYNNYPAGVSETTEYLESFLRNLLLNEDNELKNRYLHIRWNDVKRDIEETKQDIQSQKQDIQSQKQDIGLSKQDISIPDEIGNKTKQHILSLFREYGYEKFFGRTEVMHLLGITASPASTLIKKMIDSGMNNMKTIETGGITYIDLVPYGTNEWYYGISYEHGDLYEAEEVFKEGQDVEGRNLVLIHFPDGEVYRPVPKQPGIYPAEPVYYEGGIFILSVNFLQSQIQIIRFDCDSKEIKTIDKLSLSTVKNCYNLHLDIAPLTLTRQCVGSNEFEIIWPERVQFEMGDHDSFFLRDGDRLYFNRWHEDEDGSNYYDETVVRDLQGKTIEVLPGDLRIMPNGETWFLK